MSASSKHVADFSGTTLLATTFAAVLLWQAAAASVAGQESYPSRLVRMIVPFPAGGTADVLPRIVGVKLSDKWRQPVIIENRAGAGGNIGGEAVAGSPPDGYVLLARPPGPIAINDNLYKKLGFEPAKFEARHGAKRARGQADVASPDRTGAYRLRKSQSRQGHIRLTR